MIYYGIFPNGNYINSHNFADLIQVPDLVYFLKLEYLPPNNNFSVFTLIHANEKPNFLRINDIELRNIGTQYWDNHLNKTKANFTFYDYRLKQTIQTPLITHLGPKFVLDELIPFMQGYVNNIVQLIPNTDDSQTAENEQREV